MSNFEFNKDMFVKEDEKKSIFRYIPGYRSDKLIKKVIASMYYLFCILCIFIARDIGDIFIGLLLIIGFVFGCHISDLIFIKDKRNLKNIRKNIGLPFLAIVVCFVGVGVFGTVFNPQEAAAKELGISLEDYNNIIKQCNDIINENKSLEESKKASKLDYENKQKEYDNLVKEFDEYKESISEESIKELDNLRNANENYQQKISNLEKKIYELESKLD